MAETPPGGRDPLRGGVAPFWFWNGPLEPAEIRRQVAEMARQGIVGFFIHPRQGMGLPYMSKAFLDAVEVAVEAAEQLGLAVHFYDEFPYPSGAAGGEVSLGRPDLLATRLVQQHLDVRGGPIRWTLPPGEVLHLSAWPTEDGRVDYAAEPTDLREAVGIAFTEETYNDGGLTPYNRKRFLACRPAPQLLVDLPERPWRLHAAVQCLIDNHKYWGHFPDLLNPEAVRRYIALTHDRYAERFAERFGRSILSIFTDETHLAWSARLPKVFRQRTGYDLPPLLPALVDPDHPDHLRTRRDRDRVFEAMYVEAFDKPIRDWCRQHNLLYSGERTMYSFGQFALQDIPGCEPGHTKAGAETLDLFRWPLRGHARAAASASYFHGKPATLCECYHSMGWGATLQDARLIADNLLLAGIDLLVPHGFFYSTAGLRKHDAPPSYFFQMPYWNHFGRLTERVRRLHGLLAEGWIDAKVLVIDPQCLLGDDADRLACQRLHELLVGNQVDYHVVDEALLRQGRIDDGRLHLKDLAARVVIVPPGPWLDDSLADWLDDFRAAGGTVLRFTAGDDEEAILSAVCRSAPPTLQIGGDRGQVLSTCRTNGEHRRWLLVSQSPDPLDLALDAERPLRELPVDPDLPPRLKREADGYRRILEPFEAVVLTDRPGGAEQTDLADLPLLTVRATGRAQVRPLDPNLLRLGGWTLALPGQDDRAVPVEPTTLADQLRKTALAYRPTVEGGFGQPVNLRLPMLTCRYETTFRCDFAGPVELVLEPTSIAGAWRMDLNGRPIRSEDFQPTDTLVAGNRGLDVTDRLVPGENRLRIEVTTDRPDGGLRNTLYLAGDFGVDLDGPTLTDRPAEGGLESYRENRLPFYAGAIEYETVFDLDDLPDGPTVLVRLECDQPFHAAAEVAFNDGPARPMLWEPRLLVVSKAELRAGRNRLTMRVWTSLLRAFEGQWFDDRTHTTRNVEDSRPG